MIGTSALGFIAMAKGAVAVLLQPMTPRQINMLASATNNGSGGGSNGEEALGGDACGSAGNVTTIRAIDEPQNFNPRRVSDLVKTQAEQCAPCHTLSIVVPYMSPFHDLKSIKSVAGSLD